MLAPGHDMAVTYMNSQWLGKVPQDLDKIEQLKIPAWVEQELPRFILSPGAIGG